MSLVLLTLLAFGVSAAACGSETHTETAESQVIDVYPGAGRYCSIAAGGNVWLDEIVVDDERVGCAL